MRESPMYQEILEEGREEGREEALQQVAVNLMNSGMALEQVAQATGLSIEKLRVLLK